MKWYIRIFAISAIFASVQVWADTGFLKAGVGAGFDSNIFSDQDAFSGFFGAAKVSGEGITGGEEVKLIGAVDLNAEMNPYYFSLDVSANGGLIIMPDLFTVFRANAGYRFLMNINHSADLFFEAKRDLGQAVTFDVAYDYNPVFSLSGTSNESVFNHSLNGGFKIELMESLYLLARAGYGLRNYFELPLGGDILRNQDWNVEGGIVILPDYDTSIKAVYQYSRYLSSSSAFTVFSTTNMLYQYNDAEVHSIALEAGLDVGFDVSFRLLGKIDFIRLIPVSKYETAYLAVLKTDIFLDPSWKLEIPVTLSGISGAVSPSFLRVKAGIDIFYLF